jgi:hypothetical protein
MAKRTADVKELVLEVLATMPRPYSEDLTDEVCVAIERNPQWLGAYRRLESTLSHDVVNKSIGRYVSKAVGGRGIAVAKPASSLIASYSKLAY